MSWYLEVICNTANLLHWFVIFYLAFICNQNAPAQTRLLHHDDGPSAQVEALVVPQGQARLFDKYSDVPFNDEKARLDNFAIELHQNPGNTGYIIVFGKIGKARYLAKSARMCEEELLYFATLKRNFVSLIMRRENA